MAAASIRAKEKIFVNLFHRHYSPEFLESELYLAFYGLIDGRIAITAVTPHFSEGAATLWEANDQRDYTRDAEFLFFLLYAIEILYLGIIPNNFTA